MTRDTSHTDDYVPDVVRIAEQNDRWRRAICATPPGMTGPDGLGGRVVFTQAVAARGPLFLLLCLSEIAGHEAFDPENDPDRLYDFGAVKVEGVRVWFKIDLFADEGMEWGAERPDDPNRTYRVMTVMFPSDW
jgi:hypothetical protein